MGGCSHHCLFPPAGPRSAYLNAHLQTGLTNPLDKAIIAHGQPEIADVAKQSAGFLLLDKDLAVLHCGIVQGCTTFVNTLKYVYMATGANFGNMFSVAGASLLLPFLPMLPRRILLINFLTDLPEMTIARDNVDPVLVQEPQACIALSRYEALFLFGQFVL